MAARAAVLEYTFFRPSSIAWTQDVRARDGAESGAADRHPGTIAAVGDA